MNFKTLREKQKALLEDLETIQAAMKLLSDEPGREKPTGKKTRRKMSAATRAKMRASAKKRWQAAKKTAE